MAVAKENGGMRLSVRGCKVFFVLFRLEMDKRREEQDHISALVHDRRATIGTANFARELVLGGLLGAVIPAQVMVAVGEVDIFLVEDGGPLKGSPLRHELVWLGGSRIDAQEG